MRGRHLFAQWIVAEAPDLKHEILEIYVPLRPIGKERTHGLNHSTPQKTRDWENYLGSVTANDLMEGKPTITFPVAARVIFGVHKNRADIDNIEKALWDGLQKGDVLTGKGAALSNDNLVRGFVQKVEHEMPKGEEFIWVRFYARRAEDFSNYMEQCNDHNDAGY